MDVYIHSCYTLVGLLVGDCRESSTQDNRHRFRARFVVDVNSGTMVGTPAISETCDRLGLCFGGIGGAPNGWLFAASNNGGTTVHGHLLNYHPLFGNPVVAPAIDFQLDFKMDGKALDGSFGGDGYPTFAVFKGENGYWGAGKIFSEGHFLQLASPLGTWTVKCLFRIP